MTSRYGVGGAAAGAAVGVAEEEQVSGRSRMSPLLPVRRITCRAFCLRGSGAENGLP